MTKRMEVEVDGARATYVLLEDWTPKTVAALWESLPVETPVSHGKSSGSACYFNIEGGPMAGLPQKPELGVTSIYKGYIMAVPKPAHGKAELLLSYGLAEYRGATGRMYGTPVAELEGDGGALFDALARTQVEGRKTIKIRRVEG